MQPHKSAGNEHVAKGVASLFASEEDSDCVVVFCLKASSLLEPAAPVINDGPVPKRQRLQDGSALAGGRGDCIIVGEPLPGHQLVLRFASERFGAQLKRWDTRKSRTVAGTSEQSVAPAATVDGRPVLRVQLGCEAEEPSARIAIRYAYTGDVQVSSIREAFEVRRQAVYLQIEGCAAACMHIIKSKLAQTRSASESSSRGAPPGATDSGCAAVNSSNNNSNSSSCGPDGKPPPPVLELYSCEPLWPDPADEPDFAAIISAATPQLVQHFGDVLRTLNTRSLRQQLLTLPARALEVLLQSDGYGTDNESSVLLLLATWMETNYKTTDVKTRERLCRQVRLVQLSRPYLTCVLPILALDFETSAQSPAGWFPVSGTEATFICSLATAQPPVREALLAAGRKLYDMTAPWYSATPRRQCLPAAGLVYRWHIPQPELAKALDGLQPGGLCCTAGSFEGDFNFVVASGFEWWPSIEYRHGAAEANLGLYSQMPEAYQVGGSRFCGEPSKVVTVAGVDADLSVHHWQKGTIVDDGVYFNTSKDVWPVGGGRGANVVSLGRVPQGNGNGGGNRNSGGGAGPLAGWGAYISEGKIAGTLMLLPPSAGA